MSRDELSQLAVLIGAPHAGDVAMHHDLNLMHHVMLARGLQSEQILRLEGSLETELLLGFLFATGKRILRCEVRRLLLYVSGHGFFAPNSPDGFDIGLLLNDKDSPEQVSWSGLFAALALPADVEAIVLPDH